MMGLLTRGIRDKRLTFELACKKGSLARARTKVLRFAERNGFSMEAEDVALATQEALKNIIQHACPVDGVMRLACSTDGDAMVVEVSDRGEGFDVEAVESEPSPLMAVHGRGLKLIRGLMDDVSINSDRGGTLVRMEKRHGG